MHRTFQDARRQVHADDDAARGALPLDDPPEHELAELDARLGGGNVQDDHVESTAQRAGEATDLYAVIGVARDVRWRIDTNKAPSHTVHHTLSFQATDEEIKSAYRRLSMIFHPDKHRDPERKRKAEQQFTAIHAAYEVLADGNKRALYDLYGLEGLERVSEMQVGPRLKSKAEVCRCARERRACVRSLLIY